MSICGNPQAIAVLSLTEKGKQAVLLLSSEHQSLNSMCGIFAYIGPKDNAAEMVLEGLKLLEYRGYDSWGIAIKNGHVINVQKNVGKIGSAKITLPKSTLGIGHTRWATHGGVTVKNAHPHTDCKKQIAVIHNGIIENFEEIKEDLLKKGHKFVSQTDTEVMAHLIEEYLKNEGFATSVKKAFLKVKGFNAFVVSNAISKEIIAVKSGSPLVAGVGENEFYLASDTIGIVKHTRKIIFLEDNQMIILGDKLKLIELPKGNEIKPKIHTIDWKFDKSDKGKYKHFLEKEIYEQPKVIENIATSYKDQSENFAKLVNNASEVFFLGCGTASYAALVGTYFFSRTARRQVNFEVGSEFEYLEEYVNSDSLVVAISQSGETIDVVGPVTKAKKKGAKIMAITNVLGSTLYRQADYKILLNAGPEKAVIGTKSFTAMVAVLLMGAYALAGRLDVAKESLEKSVESVEKILNKNYISKIKSLAKSLKNREHVYVIGRGISYPASLEVALKLKETAYIHAEGFAGGELKHGVIALIENNTPCIVIAPNDETYSDVISSAQEIKARGGFIIGIGSRENKVFDVFLKTDDCNDATIIPQIVIVQLLAYFLALEKGLKDPDKPRNLAKSVVVK